MKLRLLVVVLCFLPLAALGGELPQKERLLYEVTFSHWMSLGFAEMNIQGMAERNQTPVMVFVTKAWNAEWMHGVYPVDITVSSQWDPAQRRSLWHQKKILQDKLQQQLEVSFDYKTKTATWTQDGYKHDDQPYPPQGVMQNIPLDLQDPLSVAYFARSYPGGAAPDMKFGLVTFDDLKLSGIEMSILSREEIELTINGKTRKLPALLVEPKFAGTGLFKRKQTGNRLLMWIHDAPGRQLLRMKSEIAVGNIWMDLKEADPF